jgi:hypothetical protein
MKIKVALLGLFLSASAAFAQTAPNWTQGFVPTPAQWNAVFAGKQDFLGSAPLLVNGGVLTGELVTAPSVASSAGLNIPPGVAPTSPVNGDLWSTPAGFFVQVNGATIGPLTEGTSGSFAATTPIGVSFSGGTVTYSCATCGVTGSPLSQFASTTSAQLAGIISNETGTGLLVFNAGASMSALTVTGSFTATGLVTNADLTNSTISGIALGANLNALTFGTHLTGTSYNGSTAVTIATDATNANTLSTIVARDASGNFSAGTITASLTGHASLDLALTGGTISGAITYGGVTLANSVTGTGSMVLGTAPSISSLTVTTAFTATGLVTFSDMATVAIASPNSVIAGTGNFLVPVSSIYIGEQVTTFGATTTFDFSTFINTAVTLTGNITTQTLANVKGGQAGQIRFIQDGTGSRTTVWNSIFKFTGGVTPSLSTAAGSIDVLFYSCVSSSLCYAGLNQNMK